MTSKYNLIAVTGPTASGKTAFAARLAHALDGEVISADSRQVYRRMNLGTGKDYDDYLVDGVRIPAHLIDIAEPGYRYNVFEYQRDFFKAFNDITGRNKLPVLCGGSGMYIDAATHSYRLQKVPFDERLRDSLKDKTLGELSDMLSKMKTLHNKTDTDTREHALRAIEIQKYYEAHDRPEAGLPEIRTLYIGILYDRKEERDRITVRLNKRLSDGLVEEVKQLLESGISPETLMYYGLEYRYITMFLLGKIGFEAMKTGLNTAIHQYAKRQRTWFRKMEREGCSIHWLDGHLPLEDKLKATIAILNTRK